MKRIGIAALSATAMAFALPAAAQSVDTKAFYAGLNFGQSKFNADCSGLTSCDTKDTALKFFGGYSFNKNWAAELGYADLGKAKFSGPGGDDELKGSAFDLTGVFTWPFSESFSVFGRAGLYNGELKLSGVDTGSKSTTDLTYGLGAGYDFNRNFGLRAEWQRYSKMKAHNDATGADDSGDVDAMTIGVLYRFQ
jgi:OOP family OmpA-OmpF porin